MGILLRLAFASSLVACAGKPAAPPARQPPPPASASTTAPTSPCQNASAEMTALEAADQADRRLTPTPGDLPRIQAADRQRRKRVTELNAAGCLTTGTDFALAAIVYQHGETPDDYLQAFHFAARAVQLGNTTLRGREAQAIDRWLVSTKHKQLFGSQSLRRDVDGCWCLLPVEPTFPDDQRVAYTGKTLAQQIGDVKASNATASACKKVECDADLQPTPQGSVAGVW